MSSVAEAASVFDLFGVSDSEVSPYILARRKFMPKEEYNRTVAELASSSTLYVGNLSFFTTEEQIYELFQRVGDVKRIIMGLNKHTKTPCGFCFVEYYTHEDALSAVRLLSGTKLDDRPIRADLDPGFKEGRQYGRAADGGQVRDAHRVEYDPDRPTDPLAAAQTPSSSSAAKSTDSPRPSSHHDSSERSAKRPKTGSVPFSAPSSSFSPSSSSSSSSSSRAVPVDAISEDGSAEQQ